MKNLIKDFVSEDILLFLRNNLNIRPLGYSYLKKNIISISDFFFWNTKNKFDTKINITNLASQVLPKIKQDCNVIFIFFDSNGKVIFNDEINLKYFQSYSFSVSKYCPNNFGSVAIFHRFKNFKELKEHGSFVTEKGYVGYNYDNGPWSYVHGNNSSLSYSIDKKIFPLLSSTILKINSYIPQVRFDDCTDSSLVFNNPLDIDLRTTVDIYDKNWLKLHSIQELTKPKNTKILHLGDMKKSYVKIKSNMILFRPMILKKYETYFDIFHG